jgi:hypothetical protein
LVLPLICKMKDHQVACWFYFRWNFLSLLKPKTWGFFLITHLTNFLIIILGKFANFFILQNLGKNKSKPNLHQQQKPTPLPPPPHGPPKKKTRWPNLWQICRRKYRQQVKQEETPTPPPKLKPKKAKIKKPNLTFTQICKWQEQQQKEANFFF